MPLESRHVDLGAQHGLTDGDRDLDLEILTLTLEVGMRLDLHRDGQIAGRTSSWCRARLDP